MRLEGTAGRSRGMEVWPPCEALEEGGRPRWCPQEVHFFVGASKAPFRWPPTQVSSFVFHPQSAPSGQASCPEPLHL